LIEGLINDDRVVDGRMLRDGLPLRAEAVRRPPPSPSRTRGGLEAHTQCIAVAKVKLKMTYPNR
jgi:hypothetical protein